ncbi:MAG: hypothetical protein KJ963_00550, partial [Bacteroidetes bacterium]|nr:hypothetical protein [Bacteroidota bacterium]
LLMISILLKKCKLKSEGIQALIHDLMVMRSGRNCATCDSFCCAILKIFSNIFSSFKSKN